MKEEEGGGRGRRKRGHEGGGGRRKREEEEGISDQDFDWDICVGLLLDFPVFPPHKTQASARLPRSRRRIFP